MMIRNSRGKKTLSFGIGSPYQKQVKVLKIVPKFPSGSVFQVMPPSSIEDEILKGTTNGDISSAYPNKDTIPPNLTQEGHGQTDHFEVNHFDFSIEDMDENELDSVQTASSKDKISFDKKVNVEDENLKSGREKSSSVNQENSLESDKESCSDIDNESSQTSDNSTEENKEENERDVMENWFKIL